MRAIAVILALVFAASASAQPHVQRPAELSDSDWSEIKSALAKYTHDEIRTIRVSSTSPLSVQVHTASPHIVTEGDFHASESRLTLADHQETSVDSLNNTSRQGDAANRYR